MGGALRKLDARVAAFESALIVALFGVMVASVFLDACHRVFASGEGRVERLLVWLLPDGAAGMARAALAPALLAAATFAIAYGAFRARALALGADAAQTSTPTAPPPVSRRRLAGKAALVTLALGAASQVLVRALPNGLVWSQQMSLCLLLWVGLVGASLATRERAHIAFELAGKLWPRPLARAAELAARAIAGGFTLLLALLAARFAADHYAEWSSSGGAAGLFEGFRVPRFVIYGFLPLPLVVMGLRFLAYGVRAPQDAGEAAAP